MVILIICFVLSLAGGTLLVWLKAREGATGRVPALLAMVPRDPELETRTRAYLEQLRVKLIEISLRLTRIVLRLLARSAAAVERELRAKRDGIRNTIRGKSVLHKNGSASFYLRDIAAHRDNIREHGGTESS